MTEPARRRHFQVHLSTAIWLSLAAGVILWMNIGEFEPEFAGGGELFLKGVPAHRVYGWPQEFLYSTEKWSLWDYQKLIFDLAVTMTILLTVWFVCERRIRRQEAQKKT